ncbi:MAG: hypothetical protein Q8P27_03575, partial [Candidatus Peregrinibacteria bacterium]|nr:hypothetical protein [Candidatus Peregrinibacteria bacterium]
MWDWIVNNWLYVILGIVAVYVGWKLFWFSLRLGYRVFRDKDKIYLLVTMPREESQKDKEKATEKDFREKIGIMEQLY